MRLIYKASLLILVIFNLVIVGCSIKPAKYGEPIVNRQATLVKDILANPKAYEGKVITIEGKIANECSTGCWFFVKVGQGNLSIYVDTGKSGFAIPQKVGKEIVVEGAVKIKGTGPMIQAKGVEIR